MSSNLKVGNLTAEKGKKIQGYLDVCDTNLKIPITLINGNNNGKTVVITSGIHGGEYLGIETAIRLAAELNPDAINGKIIIAHPVNTSAFFERMQYVCPYDAKNLNRMFPGKAKGTISEKIAHVITKELYSQADFFMDLHGGDLHEELHPFVVYADSGDEEVNRITIEASALMGIKYLIKFDFPKATFGAGSRMGIPGFLSEMGKCGLWNEQDAVKYMKGVKNVLKYLNVLHGNYENLCEDIVYLDEYYSANAKSEGCWYPCVKAGDTVKKGDKIGEIKDFFSNVICEYYAETDGVILYVVRSLAIKADDPIYAIG